MFERFTDRARQVMVRSQEFVNERQQAAIGPEHLLGAMLHPDAGIPYMILSQADVRLEQYVDFLEKVSPRRSEPTGSTPFTPEAKKMLEMALREALGLGDNYIGPEHLLLGLLRMGPTADIAWGILTENFAVNPDAIKKMVLNEVTPSKKPPHPPVCSVPADVATSFLMWLMVFEAAIGQDLDPHHPLALMRAALKNTD